ncbi:hypothetical protein [Nocardioides sp. 1609]|uniref:hypothetical protein n=1 Tax=Nocardioides sp. 1609 TaxID=2508327 RepID=UPI00106F7EBD|nr:hypothetical protein [Nocardioides sp. 1609]
MPEYDDHPVSRRGLTRPSRVSRTGGQPTPKEARGPSWRRTSRGFYLPSDVDDARPEQRILNASTAQRNGVAITGWAALRWRGGRWFDGVTAAGARRPVTVLIGTRDIDAQPRHGIAVCGESVGPSMYDVVDGVAVTLPTWAVSFEMRYARSEHEAAKVLSLAAYDDLVSIAEVRAFFSGQRGWTGIPQARKALTWAEENAWSPGELDLGIHLYVELHHERPLFNRPVFDLAERHLFTPDLIDPVAGVVFEHNGPTHRESTAYGNDLHRWGLYAEHGLEAVASSSADLRDCRRLDERVRTAYRRAARRARSDRSWTVEPPAGWTPTHTVDLRRALTPRQRARLLRYRAA